MTEIGTIWTVCVVLYIVVAVPFLVIENRRPQATLAWTLAFVFLPGLGLLAYVLFGRNRKAFAKQSKLLRQDLEANAKPVLSEILARQDEEIKRLEDESGSGIEADDAGQAQLAFRPDAAQHRRDPAGRRALLPAPDGGHRGGPPLRSICNTSSGARTNSPSDSRIS